MNSKSDFTLNQRWLHLPTIIMATKMNKRSCKRKPFKSSPTPHLLGSIPLQSSPTYYPLGVIPASSDAFPAIGQPYAMGFVPVSSGGSSVFASPIFIGIETTIIRCLSSHWPTLCNGICTSIIRWLFSFRQPHIYWDRNHNHQMPFQPLANPMQWDLYQYHQVALQFSPAPYLLGSEPQSSDTFPAIGQPYAMGFVPVSSGGSSVFPSPIFIGIGATIIRCLSSHWPTLCNGICTSIIRWLFSFRQPHIYWDRTHNHQMPFQPLANPMQWDLYQYHQVALQFSPAPYLLGSEPQSSDAFPAIAQPQFIGIGINTVGCLSSDHQPPIYWDWYQHHTIAFQSL